MEFETTSKATRDIPKTYHIDNLVDMEIRNAEMLAELDISSSELSLINIPLTEHQTEIYHLHEHP